MTKNTWFALIFLIFVLCVALWKFWAWIIWKVLRLRKKEQVFDLISKHRFIEITGSSGKGKSWLLMHLFKNLEGVKFTNCPTPQSTYTLHKETLEIHISGKWGTPNKFYYFLDDIDTFQKWSQKEFGEEGYSALKEYFSHMGKLGGTAIWTNNGIEPEHILKVQKNKVWKVLTYISFMDKSLLFVQANDSWYNLLPTIIPVDNKEIESFYDPHWNIPKQIQKNWLTYIAEKLQAEELKAILQVIEEGNENLSLKEYDHNIYRKLLHYIKLREKEEEVVKDKSQKISRIKQKLKKYGVSNKKITPQDIVKWDKEKNRQKSKKSKKLENITEEEDLDQNNQDSDLLTEDNQERYLENSSSPKDHE